MRLKMAFSIFHEDQRYLPGVLLAQRVPREPLRLALLPPVQELDQATHKGPRTSMSFELRKACKIPRTLGAAAFGLSSCGLRNYQKARSG